MTATLQTFDHSTLRNVRIAHVTSVPFFLVTQLKGQMEYLRDIGMQVTMITSAGPELAHLTLGPGFEHAVVEIRRKPAPFRDLLALLRMIRLFRQYRFDIVHSTTPKAGLLTALAGFLARVPVRLHTFTGQQWVTMSGILRFVSRFSDRMIGWLNTRCYADSPSQRQYLIDEGILSAERIGVIGSGSLAGVDVMRFRRDRFLPEERVSLRSELGIANGARVLVYIGRITRDKGVLELLAAFRNLQAEGIAVELLLVGPMEVEGDTQSASLKQALQQSQVHCIGYTNVPERYLAIADILCLPSYREGFGTVVIEAAAMGVPTVGTRINGLKDAIVECETGLLVEPRNAEALYAALAGLLAAPEQLARMGTAARERALQLFNARQLNQCLVDEYLRLLGDTGRVSNPRIR